MAVTRSDLVRHLRELGIVPGDIVMVHAALRALGLVGSAQCQLIDAADIVHFGVQWLEARHGQGGRRRLALH